MDNNNMINTRRGTNNMRQQHSPPTSPSHQQSSADEILHRWRQEMSSSNSPQHSLNSPITSQPFNHQYNDQQPISPTRPKALQISRTPTSQSRSPSRSNSITSLHSPNNRSQLSPSSLSSAVNNIFEQREIDAQRKKQIVMEQQREKERRQLELQRQQELQQQQEAEEEQWQQNEDRVRQRKLREAHRKNMSSTEITRTAPKRSRLSLANLDHQLSHYPLLTSLERRTGIRAAYFAVVVFIFLILLVFCGVGMGLLCFALGFALPLYKSIKCIEEVTTIMQTNQEYAQTPQAGAVGRLIQEEQQKNVRYAKREMRVWLIYWIVYCLFELLEAIGDRFLSFLPMYYPLKLIFLLWCFLPQFQGCLTVFSVFVRPVLVRHEKNIDSTVSSTTEAVSRVGTRVRSLSRQLSQSVLGGESAVPTDPLASSSSSASRPSTTSQFYSSSSRATINELASPS